MSRVHNQPPQLPFIPSSGDGKKIQTQPSGKPMLAGAGHTLKDVMGGRALVARAKEMSQTAGGKLGAQLALSEGLARLETMNPEEAAAFINDFMAGLSELAADDPERATNFQQALLEVIPSLRARIEHAIGARSKDLATLQNKQKVINKEQAKTKADFESKHPGSEVKLPAHPRQAALDQEKARYEEKSRLLLSQLNLLTGATGVLAGQGIAALQKEIPNVDQDFAQDFQALLDTTESLAAQYLQAASDVKGAPPQAKDLVQYLDQMERCLAKHSGEWVHNAVDAKAAKAAFDAMREEISAMKSAAKKLDLKEDATPAERQVYAKKFLEFKAHLGKYLEACQNADKAVIGEKAADLSHLEKVLQNERKSAKTWGALQFIAAAALGAVAVLGGAVAVMGIAAIALGAAGVIAAAGGLAIPIAVGAVALAAGGPAALAGVLSIVLGAKSIQNFIRFGAAGSKLQEKQEARKEMLESMHTRAEGMQGIYDALFGQDKQLAELQAVWQNSQASAQEINAKMNEVLTPLMTEGRYNAAAEALLALGDAGLAAAFLTFYNRDEAALAAQQEVISLIEAQSPEMAGQIRHFMPVLNTPDSLTPFKAALEADRAAMANGKNPKQKEAYQAVIHQNLAFACAMATTAQAWENCATLFDAELAKMAEQCVPVVDMLLKGEGLTRVYEKTEREAQVKAILGRLTKEQLEAVRNAVLVNQIASSAELRALLVNFNSPNLPPEENEAPAPVAVVEEEALERFAEEGGDFGLPPVEPREAPAAPKPPAQPVPPVLAPRQQQAQASQQSAPLPPPPPQRGPPAAPVDQQHAAVVPQAPPPRPPRAAPAPLAVEGDEPPPPPGPPPPVVAAADRPRNPAGERALPHHPVAQEGGRGALLGQIETGIKLRPLPKKAPKPETANTGGMFDLTKITARRDAQSLNDDDEGGDNDGEWD